MQLMRFAGRLALGLACTAGLADAYATPANLAKMAQREGLELGEIIEGLARLKDKRGLDWNKPVPGKKRDL